MQNEECKMKNQDRDGRCEGGAVRPASPFFIFRSSFFILLALSLVGAACTEPVKPIFPVIDPPIVWPMPPDRPRIRYIGQLVGEESLHAPKNDWLAELIAGPRSQARFSTPTAVAVRGEVVYVADPQSRQVHVLDLSGRTFRSIGAAAGEPLEWPMDVAVTEKRLALVDSRRASVFLFDPAGGYIQILGEGLFVRPTSVVWDADRRYWWVVDAGVHACLVLDEFGAPIRTVGERGGSLGQFNYPSGLAHSRHFGAAVADSMNFRVQILDPEGRPLLAFGQKGNAAGDFSMPRDVAVDSESHVYVLDNQFENVQIFDRSGRLLMAFGQEGRWPGEFYLPSGITIDRQDRIWIADTYNRRVQVFQYLKGAAGREADNIVAGAAQDRVDQ